MNKENKESTNESFELLINARASERLKRLTEKEEQCIESNNVFLDTLDDFLENKTGTDRYRVIPQREFTSEMDDFFDEILYTMTHQELEKYEGDDKKFEFAKAECEYMSSAKYVVTSTMKSGSEIPIYGFMLYIKHDLKEQDDSADDFEIDFTFKGKDFQLPKNLARQNISEKIEELLTSDEAMELYKSHDSVMNILTQNNFNEEKFILLPSSDDMMLISVYGLEPCSDIARSKDIVVAINTLKSTTYFSMLSAMLENDIKKTISKSFDVSVKGFDVHIYKDGDEVIYVGLDEDNELTIDSEYNRNRAMKIINSSLEKIRTYFVERLILMQYIEEISKIGKERGLIESDDNGKITVALGKEIKNVINLPEGKTEEQCSPVDIIEALEKYIDEHPEELDFIEDKKEKE